MSFLEILLLAVGLSMDSLAVSVTSGAVMKECSVRRVVKIAFVLAFFRPCLLWLVIYWVLVF